MPQEVGPMLYRTSIIFNSLDKIRDEGDYKCSVDVIFAREDQKLTISKFSNTVIAVPSKFKFSLLILFCILLIILSVLIIWDDSIFL